MFSIKKCKAPENTMLARYSIVGSYTDCYVVEIPKCISIDKYIFAFYTTFLFKVERLILKWIVSKHSTDAQVSQLAEGKIENFAAWHVERRSDNEILMCDIAERTRSWLMVEPMGTADDPRTRLYFGSSIVPVRNPKTGEQSLGFVFQALLGFHKVYSLLLLYSAKRRIDNQN
jgi:hypothetical protein